MATETLVVGHDDVTLDLLLWRHFRRAYDGMVERTLDLNPGLSSFTVLPLGRRVIVDLPPPSQPGRAAALVTLWN